MDYERIGKPQGGGGGVGGGFSPVKLRKMLLGGDKKKKEEADIDSSSTSRSHITQIDDTGDSNSDNCKDVDIVSEVPNCSSSITAESLAAQIVRSDRRLKDHQHSVNSRHRRLEDQSFDYDSGQDNVSVSSSVFEFQKADRAPQKISLGPYSKPAPSKWDDAQKWIASPNSNRPKAGQVQVPGGSRKVPYFGYGSRQSSLKVVEVSDQKVFAYEEPDMKRVDMNQIQNEFGMQRSVSWEADPYSISDSYSKPVLMIENFVAKTEISHSRQDIPASMLSTTTFIPPPSTARSVSMRDMGTEMTPIASQEPSRNGTPVRATTPIRSPYSSRPSSPRRHEPTPSPSNPSGNHLESNKDMSEKELQMKTRREIIALGTQLGKMNIAAWASKEEEDKDAFTSLKTVASEQPSTKIIETRATSWEEAEKAKYTARFKREEMKIQAWENHQKAKTEADLRRIEVDVERIKGRAHDKLMNKLDAVRHKAEEKRAAAEAKRDQQAAITEQQAEYIRRTGRVPSSIFCWNWCS